MISVVVENGNWGLREHWEDIKQDVHRKLFINFKQDKFEFRSPLKYYVYAISKYTCFAYIRNRYARPEFPVEAEDLIVSEPQPGYSIDQEIRKTALQMLPDECRRIFRLFFYEGFNYREIGEQLKIQEGTVKSRMFRCKQKARRIRRLLLKKKELL